MIGTIGLGWAVPTQVATEFQHTTPGWVIQREFRRLGEWLDLVLFSRDRRLSDYLPDWKIPPWLLPTIFWVIILSLATWAGWQLYRLLAPYLYRLWRSEADYVVVGAPTTETMTPVEEWLRRSRQAHHQGNYREACRALYMATLQKLSDADLIRQQASRTDGEYLLLLSDLPHPHPYAELVRVHQELCFGDRPITAETYAQCQRAFQEIAG